MRKSVNGLVLAATAGGLVAGAAQAQILVYDANSRNNFALSAAELCRPGEVQRAGSGDFNSFLASQTWELVVLDMPSTLVADFGPLISYIGDGNKVIASTWSSGWNSLAGPMGALSHASFSHQTGGQSFHRIPGDVADQVWDGITEPKFVSSFPQAWGSDGSRFQLAAGSVGLANINDTGDPVWMLGNDGNTIAVSVIDEWDDPIEAVDLWENLMKALLDGATGCYADCDGDGQLTIFDFLCFQNAFASGEPYADCDGDGSLTIFDFLCFQNAFARGCD